MPHKIAKSRRTGEYVPIDHPDAQVEEIKGEYREVVMTSDPAHPMQHVATTYVPVEHLDQYVAEARTRWPSVVVPAPDVHNSGPGGDMQHWYDDEEPAK